MSLNFISEELRRSSIIVTWISVFTVGLATAELAIPVQFCVLFGDGLKYCESRI
jgi:hypothetical protein